jgi:TrmH family RNA methyltransferase
MPITSPQNPRIKQTLKLRDSRQRRRDNLMLVEGYDELSLALACGVRLTTLFFCPALFGDQSDLLAEVREAGAELIEVSRSVFEKLAYRENPDGWLAVAPLPRQSLREIRLSARPLFIVAEAVEKPGNLGAILRTADAAGVDGVIVCDPTIDLGNPNLLRASRGTVFSVPVAEASSVEALAWLREQKVRVVAASPEGGVGYTEADFRGPTAIVVGEENAGLSLLWREGADLNIHIPMTGRINSLNVSVATALLVYEAVRQRAQ